MTLTESATNEPPPDVPPLKFAEIDSGSVPTSIVHSVPVAVVQPIQLTLPPATDEAVPTFEAWLRLAPFDGRAHEGLLNALAASGRLREGDEHLAVVARQYEAEGQDWGAIGHAWRAAKQRRIVRSRDRRLDLHQSHEHQSRRTGRRFVIQRQSARHRRREFGRLDPDELRNF